MGTARVLKKSMGLTPTASKQGSKVVPRIYHGEVIRDDSAQMIESFLERPQQFIAEAITGGIISGTSGLLESTGRIVQGVIKGQFKQQFAKELSQLIKEGKIKKDFAEKLYGFQTFAELIEMIDSGELKEKEKFEALKKLFFVLNASEDRENETVTYRLFKIAQKVTSSQLALLRACYKLAPNNSEAVNVMSYVNWRSEVLRELKHDVPDFIDEDEAILTELKLLNGREHADRSGVKQKNWRLTDSGYRLCKILESNSI